MATKQIVPLNSAKILHLYNSDNVEYYVGLGYFLPINQNIYGLCSPYILLQKYFISNTLKTQGLTGDWFDDNGNKYSFNSSGVVITTPSNTTKTIELPNPDSDKTAILFFTYTEADGFCIAVGKNALPYDYSSQYGTYQTAQRTANDYDYAYELCDTISATNRDTYGWGTVLIVPDYNNITPNTPVRSAMCLWTNVGNYSVISDTTSFNMQSLIPINFNGFNSPLVDNPEDPYDEGGYTSTGGGGGTFDPSGDTIDVPSLPNLSVLDTGFVSMWRPTKTELLNLYNYMWSNAFDIESFKKIFANPIDAILGFGIVPLNPSISGQSELKIGNIGTGINVSKINAQYYEIDCGSVDIPEYFGSYLDYEPYTTLDLFLPYIGSIPISVDDVRTNPPKQGSIKVIYHIDILSGSCVAFIRCKNKKGQWTTCYQYNGSVFTPLPITGNDFTSLYQGVLSAVGSAVGLATNIGSKNFGGAVGNVANIAGSVMNSKPTINRAGSMGSSNGRLGSQLPYLIMNLPKQAVAFMENLYYGYPSHITSGVGSLKDYTEFDKVYLDSIPATEGELQEIETLLTSGVIL